MPEIN